MKFLGKVFLLILSAIFLYTEVRALEKPVELNVVSWGLLKEWGVTNGFEQYAKQRGMNIKLTYVEPFLVTITDCYNLLRSKGDIAIPVNFYFSN